MYYAKITQFRQQYSLITLSVLRDVHSLFQSEFSTEFLYFSFLEFPVPFLFLR